MKNGSNAPALGSGPRPASQRLSLPRCRRDAAVLRGRAWVTAGARRERVQGAEHRREYPVRRIYSSS